MSSNQYSNLSDNALNDMYHHECFTKLNEEQRTALFEETVNREIASNGGKYTCNVRLVDLPANRMGEQMDNSIFMNREMFANDKQSFKYGETTIQFDLEDSNYKAYETLLHEYQHIVQERIIDGTLETSPEVKAKFEANDFTVSEVDGQRGSQYMLGENSYDLYYMNPTELDAHKVSQEKAMELLMQHEQRFGSDDSIASYKSDIQKNGYEAKVAELQSKYGENVIQDVENTLINKYSNSNLPVNPSVERMVHNEMILSQQYIDNSNMKEYNMSNSNEKWIDLHVTRDQYDQCLRDSVNAFYEHEISSPTISNEEAISNTTQMSEEYLSALSDFDCEASTNMDSATNISSNEASVSNSAESSCDVDSGVDI